MAAPARPCAGWRSSNSAVPTPVRLKLGIAESRMRRADWSHTLQQSQAAVAVTSTQAASYAYEFRREVECGRTYWSNTCAAAS